MFNYDYNRRVITWNQDGRSFELPADIYWDDSYSSWMEPDEEQCDPETLNKYYEAKRMEEDNE